VAGFESKNNGPSYLSGCVKMRCFLSVIFHPVDIRRDFADPV
jgi:hypothetical protein